MKSKEVYVEGKEYLKMKEAAEYLGVSRVKIWRLIRDGRLKAYTDPRDERTTLVKKEDLEQFLGVRPREG